MNMISTLKILCDLCFYLTFANFIASAFGADSLVMCLPFFTLTVYMGSAFSKYKLAKFIPLIFAGFTLFFVDITFVNIFVLLPAFAYVLYSIDQMPMTIENLDYSNIFHKFIYGFLAAIFISLLAALDSFAFTCAPFGLVFLTGSVILMRMLRHDENTINQTRFKILNLLSVVGVVLFGLVISSPPFLELCKNTVKSIYLYLIAPVLLFIITQAVNILSFILSFFNFEGFNNRLEPFKMEPVESTDFINPNQYVEPGAADETIKTILIIIILAFVVLLIIRIFRALARNRYRVDNGAGVILERTIIDIVRPKRVALSGPSGKIRDMYKKIIQRCIKKGIPISISATSQDISRMSSHYFEEVKDAERIREIYINTRYGDRAASKEEVREFKRIYLRFKKMGL